MNHETFLRNRADQMIEQLVTKLRCSKSVDVRFEFVDNEQWSVVSLYLEEDDNELALRLHPDDRYELYFGYYDEEDEFQESIRTLTDEEKKAIPKSLQKVVAKVLTDEEGLRVPGALLSK